MPCYAAECVKCKNEWDEWREMRERNEDYTCPECGGVGERTYNSKPQVVVPSQELTTDFGDGSGERTYNRREYVEKCKRLGREPVGLLWQR